MSGGGFLNDWRCKEVYFTRHAIERMRQRGASEDEVRETIRNGELLEAREGRMAVRKNFPFGKVWKGKLYRMKQILVVVAEEQERVVVVTVLVFYFGEERR